MKKKNNRNCIFAVSAFFVCSLLLISVICQFLSTTSFGSQTRPQHDAASLSWKINAISEEIVNLQDKIEELKTERYELIRDQQDALAEQD